MYSSSECDEDKNDIHSRETRQLVTMMNRKKKKSGGFQVMGLSHDVMKGLLKKGYKLPTPIQRKTIPLIISGRDIVAMARTGSGKTAAFLIPMFERLQRHVNNGPRALVLSPTREIAVQTLNFTKELGKFTGLTAALILGGDKMEDQFAALHSNPDIIIATPGRLLHIVMEMNFSLKTMEYVVFDEGDRLFELGFAEQLSETLHRLPRERQTLIFSATLPGNLIEFARAGLTEPVLVRLDVDTKLNKNLKLNHVSCLPTEKALLLLHLLQTLLPKDQQAVVFFATKHHVDFFQLLLSEAGITCVSIHSGLDSSARNLAIKQFSTRHVRALLVTDVAARGVDLPFLDNVINYHFPTQPKLFLHRVGRVARAGRAGSAFSLVDPDEVPYLYDVYVFLGRSLQTTGHVQEEVWNDTLGRAPRTLCANKGNKVQQMIDSNTNLESMWKVCVNAMKKFVKTRPKASSESVRRAKELRDSHPMLPVHPVFAEEENEDDAKIFNVIRGLKLPTIFEALGRQANPQAYQMMERKRHLHGPVIAKHTERQQRLKECRSEKPSLLTRTIDLSESKAHQIRDGADVDELDLETTDFFIPYQRGNEAEERGLSVSGTSKHFTTEAKYASLNLIGDEMSNTDQMRPAGSRLYKKIWDRKRKRYVNLDAAEGTANMKRIKTESGIWIPASYKTDKYSQWLKRSHADQVPLAEGETDGVTYSARFGGVVEFPETTESQLVNSKKKQFKKKGLKDTEETADHLNGKKNGKTEMKVYGTKRWYERATAHQAEKKQRMELKNIRQPKGSRTFGQLRKPEQILKQRRLRAKMRAKKDKAGHGKPNHKPINSKRPTRKQGHR